MKRLITAFTVPFAVSFAAATAHAAPTYTSGATGASAALSVAGVVKANAAFAAVSGTAGAAYDTTSNVAAINQSVTLVDGALVKAYETIQSGVVTSEVFTTLPTSVTGTTTLANAGTSLFTQALGALPLTALGLSATAITSTTTVGIGPGGLYGTGGSSITGLSLTGSLLGALTIDGSLYANPAVNTVLLSVPGLTVTLNEQIMQSMAGSLSMSTNAVHIALNDYIFDGQALSGDVILGHSQASITGAVPEPASWAMMVGGFGLLGGLLRRRRAPAVFA